MCLVGDLVVLPVFCHELLVLGHVPVCRIINPNLVQLHLADVLKWVDLLEILDLLLLEVDLLPLVHRPCMVPEAGLLIVEEAFKDEIRRPLTFDHARFYRARPLGCSIVLRMVDLGERFLQRGLFTC